MTKKVSMTRLFDDLDRQAMESWFYFHCTWWKHITSCHIKVWKNYKNKLCILAMWCDEVKIVLNAIKSKKFAHISNTQGLELNILCFQQPKSLKGILKLQNTIKKNYLDEWALIVPFAVFQKNL